MISDRLKTLTQESGNIQKTKRKLIRLLRYNFISSNINIFENECNGKVLGIYKLLIQEKLLKP